jgi:hypothetical protein
MSFSPLVADQIYVGNTGNGSLLGTQADTVTTSDANVLDNTSGARCGNI